MRTVLVTGGTGYIGSHMCKLLASQGHDVVVFDIRARSSATVAQDTGIVVDPDQM